jgi:hypothetical protein
MSQFGFAFLYAAEKKKPDPQFNFIILFNRGMDTGVIISGYENQDIRVRVKPIFRTETTNKMYSS